MKQNLRTQTSLYFAILAFVVLAGIVLTRTITDDDPLKNPVSTSATPYSSYTDPITGEIIDVSDEVVTEAIPSPFDAPAVTLDDLPAQKLSRQEAHETIQAIVDRGNPDYGAVVYGGADMDIGMSLADFAESKPMYKPSWLSTELYCRMVQLYNSLDDTTLRDGVFTKECHIMLPLLNLNRDIKALPQPISPS